MVQSIPLINIGKPRVEKDHNADDISEIILPLLNVDRPMENQEINEFEPQQGQLWISSASDKNTFAYDKTIELMELAIINPKNAFIWGKNRCPNKIS